MSVGALGAALGARPLRSYARSVRRLPGSQQRAAWLGAQHAGHGAVEPKQPAFELGARAFVPPPAPAPAPTVGGRLSVFGSLCFLRSHSTVREPYLELERRKPSGLRALENWLFGH